MYLILNIPTCTTKDLYSNLFLSHDFTVCVCFSFDNTTPRFSLLVKRRGVLQKGSYLRKYLSLWQINIFIGRRKDRAFEPIPIYPYQTLISHSCWFSSSFFALFLLIFPIFISLNFFLKASSFISRKPDEKRSWEPWDIDTFVSRLTKSVTDELQVCPNFKISISPHADDLQLSFIN